MVVGQILPRVNDSVHISFHQVRNDVDILVAGHGGWLLNVDESNDILVVEEFEQFDLTDNTFGVDQVFEGLGHLLDSDLGLDGVVECRADDTVRSMANLLDVLILVLHDERCARTLELCHAFGNLLFHLLRHAVLMRLLLLRNLLLFLLRRAGLGRAATFLRCLLLLLRSLHV